MADIDPREANLTALRRLTADLLEDAGDDESVREDPVNWGAVNCFMAERCEDEDGHWTLRVWIDEASPDAHELRAYLQNRLLAHGYTVEVRSEW